MMRATPGEAPDLPVLGSTIIIMMETVLWWTRGRVQQLTSPSSDQSPGPSPLPLVTPGHPPCSRTPAPGPPPPPCTTPAPSQHPVNQDDHSQGNGNGNAEDDNKEKASTSASSSDGGFASREGDRVVYGPAELSGLLEIGDIILFINGVYVSSLCIFYISPIISLLQQILIHI